MATMWLIAAQMDMAAVYNERVAIVLGFLTLLALLAVFISCRTFVSMLSHIRLKSTTESRLYRRFYQYHSYYWWAFGVLLLVHFMIAFMHTGLPEAGDPDAPIHWAILLFGLGAALTAGALFVSCRIMPRLITLATSKKPLTNGGFRAFFQSHAYYWWLVLLLAGAHFTASYIHTGVWPR